MIFPLSENKLLSSVDIRALLTEYYIKMKSVEKHIRQYASKRIVSDREFKFRLLHSDPKDMVLKCMDAYKGKQRTAFWKMQLFELCLVATIRISHGYQSKH